VEVILGINRDHKQLVPIEIEEFEKEGKEGIRLELMIKEMKEY